MLVHAGPRLDPLRREVLNDLRTGTGWGAADGADGSESGEGHLCRSMTYKPARMDQPKFFEGQILGGGNTFLVATRQCQSFSR